jgi:hypothetical protein
VRLSGVYGFFEGVHRALIQSGRKRTAIQVEPLPEIRYLVSLKFLRATYAGAASTSVLQAQIRATIQPMIVQPR